MTTDYQAMMEDVRRKNKNDLTQAKMHQKWKKLSQEMIDKINALDKDTPWSETEPKWWIEMSNVRRALFTSENNLRKYN